MERVSSAVRLELRPGEWVLWKARPFRFVSLNGSTASIRDSINAELDPHKTRPRVLQCVIQRLLGNPVELIISLL